MLARRGMQAMSALSDQLAEHLEKRQCPECRYLFAADPANAQPLCPDCARPQLLTAALRGSC
jgi:ssDNA-binding Zn-finger/Zn-ribbon topoisomerase 1